MHLTKTEIEIVKALAAGDNSTAISARRFRTKDTIQKHIKNARHKLGAKTIGQLIYLAVKQGFINSLFLAVMLSQAVPVVRDDDDLRADDRRRLRVTRCFSVRGGRVLNIGV